LEDWRYKFLKYRNKVPKEDSEELKRGCDNNPDEWDMNQKGSFGLKDESGTVKEINMDTLFHNMKTDANYDGN
jgi:hypothetical protein